MRSEPRLSLRAALPLFFAVGSGALIVETTWLRWFRGILGATAPAISATLVALTLGQLVGAFVGGALLRRAANPLRAFGVLQLLAVASAFVVEPALGLGAPSAAGTVARFALVLVVTLPTAAAIGSALPILVASCSRQAEDLGARGVPLYTADLLGAALGAGATTFLLPAWFGVRQAYALGAALLAAAALASLWLSRTAPFSKRESPGPRESRLAWPMLETAALASASGFGAFAAQLSFHQAFGRVLDQSTFAVGAVLVCALASLAIGAGAIALLRQRFPPSFLVAGSASLAALAFAGFPSVFIAATEGLSYVVTPRSTATYVPRALFLCALTAGPALITAAGVLPALFVHAGHQAEGDGRGAGHVAAGVLIANNAGAIAGAIAAPYALFPSLGLWASFVLLALLYTGVAALAVRPRRYAFAVALTLGVACSAAQPWRYPEIKLVEGDQVLDTWRSAAGLVAVIRRDEDLLIQTDNHYVLGGTADSVHQERQGHLPLLLHPGPRHVAFVGTATGSSAGVAFDHGVVELVTVEIMPGVTEAAARFFSDHNSGVYIDPRTRIVAEDIRSFVRTNDEAFDVIVADLFVPWRSETGSLYSREHLMRTRARLAPGGIFCQWLPLYQLGRVELESILATFLDVFPNAQVFRGDFYGEHAIAALMGSPEGTIDPSLASVETRRLRALDRNDRWVTHPMGPWALYVGPLDALRTQLSSAPINTDNEPVVELVSARNPSRHAGRTDWTASGLPLLQLSKLILRGQDWSSDHRSLEGRRAAAGGFALQAASTHWVRGNTSAAAVALEEAAKLLPAELLSEAPADPSASDVWPEDG